MLQQLLLLARLLLALRRQVLALGLGQMPAPVLLCLAVRVQQRLLVLPASALVLQELLHVHPLLSVSVRVMLASPEAWCLRCRAHPGLRHAAGLQWRGHR